MKLPRHTSSRKCFSDREADVLRDGISLRNQASAQPLTKQFEGIAARRAVERIAADIERESKGHLQNQRVAPR